jgi:hypothetical protein
MTRRKTASRNSPRMAKLDVFVEPQPNLRFIRFLNGVNRWLMLGGIPLARAIPGLGRLPGIKGFSDIRVWDYPDTDKAKLAALCGKGKATFITPNHPEFFTDWMIDKEIISHAAQLAACWATHGVVNGLGDLAQRFWLANNLIAQIPGDGGKAREYSINWAVLGHGVLLHPEGSVGWHANHVGPLFPGAAEMAADALQRGRQVDADFESFVAPIVWKLVFLKDVTSGLAGECAYVEKRLGIKTPDGAGPAQRVFLIYSALLRRDEMELGLTAGESAPYRERQRLVLDAIRQKLAGLLNEVPGSDFARLVRRKLRTLDKKSPEAGELKRLADMLFRVARVGEFAFARPQISQEEIAEHLKRIRNDYCSGTFKDTFNKFVPQPVGPRKAILRVAEPIAIHDWQGTADQASLEMRRRMQAKIDEINTGLTPRLEKNPFFA